MGFVMRVRFCHEGLVDFVLRNLLVFVMGFCWFCHVGFVGFVMRVLLVLSWGFDGFVMRVLLVLP